MTIYWYGENCFKLQSGELVILTDPPAEDSGLKSPRFKYKVRVETRASVPVQRMSGNQDEEFSIVGPGEYQMGPVTIRGFQLSESDNAWLKTAYVIDDGEVRLCLLGHVSKKIADPKLMEALANVDVVIVPAGGSPYIAATEAVELINQIEPSIVIPAAYKIPGLKRKSADAGTFVKEFGAKAETLEKLSVKKKDLIAEETKIVLLQPN